MESAIPRADPDYQIGYPGTNWSEYRTGGRGGRPALR